MLQTYKMDRNFTATGLVKELPSIVRAIPAAYVREQRWFGSKTHDIEAISIFDFALLTRKLPVFILLMIRVSYGGSSEIYNLPVVIKKTEITMKSSGESRDTILKIRAGNDLLHLYNAFGETDFLTRLFKMIGGTERIASAAGYFNCKTTPVFKDWKHSRAGSRVFTGRLLNAEQSNTSVVYNDSFIIKNIRKLENGTSPDLEIPLFLTTRTDYRDIPPVAGYINYAGNSGFMANVASMQKFIANLGDGWKYTLAHLNKFNGFIVMQETMASKPRAGKINSKDEVVRRFSKTYLKDIYGLGNTTGRLHIALASAGDEPDFTPVLISRSRVRAWIDEVNGFIDEVFHEIEARSVIFPKDTREQIHKLTANIDRYKNITTYLSELSRHKMYRTRYHGDLHLGQVLKTGGGFIIIDFEGEPARTLKQRRAKHTPLKDVAGMLRSFNYAVYSALFNLPQKMRDRYKLLEMWGAIWEKQVSKSFLDGYFDAVIKYETAEPVIPEMSVMNILTALQMDKAVYELHYELNNRPEWTKIPLKYLLSLIG